MKVSNFEFLTFPYFYAIFMIIKQDFRHFLLSLHKMILVKAILEKKRVT